MNIERNHSTNKREARQKPAWLQLTGLMLVLIVMLTGCAPQNPIIGGADAPALSAANGQNPSGPDGAGEKIVNIGMTYSLGTLNPLLQDAALVSWYATSLLFLPLVELDDDMVFKGHLAQSITTEDNLTFTVKLDEQAVWSDGTPITADDLIYTVLRLTDPQVGNVYMGGYSQFKGFDDSGFSPSGAQSVEGLVKVDDHTVQFVAKAPISLNTFQNSYAQYILTLPKHILADVPSDQLPTHEFFNNPSVISGPFKLVDYNKDHYIQYSANDSYYKGRPKIDKLNIKIVQGAQLYAGLQSGEIDLVLQTTGIIPVEDYENVSALENVTAVLDKPLTNQLVFINNASVPDARVRQAILYAIDREKIFNELVKGNGELIDGFATSYSPYYSADVKPLAYDPDRAKELLAQAGWDAGKELNFYISSGDSTFALAADVMVANLAAVGIKAKVTIVDFNSLMERAGNGDYDLYAVQYTIPPIDLYPDAQWLVGTGSGVGYSNPRVDELLTQTQLAGDNAELSAIYRELNTMMQQDVPLFSAYAISSLGVVNKRLTGVEPRSYGTFLNIHQWDVAQ